MDKLDAKVTIITGCSSGIEKQIAIKYAEEGAKLSICARRKDKLEKPQNFADQREQKYLLL